MNRIIIAHLLGLILGGGIALLGLWYHYRKQLQKLKCESTEPPPHHPNCRCVIVPPKDYVDETTLATEDDPHWVGWYGISGKEKQK